MTNPEPDLTELAPLLSKVAAEIGREPGAQMLRPEFLGALAARATLAAAAFVGNPLAGHHCAAVTSLKWAEEVAVHGAGASRTVDIDVHVPGVKEPVPVELPLADARDLYAMLGRTIAAELGVRPDQI